MTVSHGRNIFGIVLLLGLFIGLILLGIYFLWNIKEAPKEDFVLLSNASKSEKSTAENSDEHESGDKGITATSTSGGVDVKTSATAKSTSVKTTTEAGFVAELVNLE